MFRTLSTNKIVRRSMTARTPARKFHSPFAALESAASPLTTPPAQGAVPDSTYEKQHEHAPEPHVSHAGTRTYVVSQPDPAHTHYAVPAGAYAASAPYEAQPAAAAPAPGEASPSSASAGAAHPATTSSAPRNEGGVGESGAVRFRSAPGAMGERGGGDGGLGLMDGATTEPGSGGELADRNPPPLKELSEKFSKQGLKDAWKDRK